MSRADRKAGLEEQDVTEAGRELKRAREAGESYFGDGKCVRGEWQEKNCYEESNHNAEQLWAAPCHIVLVVHVAAVAAAGVAIPSSSPFHRWPSNATKCFRV